MANHRKNNKKHHKKHHVRGKGRWGPVTQRVWNCGEDGCWRRLHIRRCMDPKKANFGRSGVKVSLLPSQSYRHAATTVQCFPRDTDDNPIHPPYYRWCNDWIPDEGAEDSDAPMDSEDSDSDVPCIPVEGRQCLLPTCRSKRVADLCGRCLCSQHCALAGGCFLHLPLSSADLAFLGVQPVPQQ